MDRPQDTFSDILNIHGEQIPDIDEELEQLLEKGKHTEQQLLIGASMQVFGKRTPYAVTHVRMEFDNEPDLRRCVRLLRWSDERLMSIGKPVAWAWNRTVREGMTIRFSVNWYEKEFFESKRHAFTDSNHLSYYRMFGKSTSDMDIYSEVLGSK